VDRACFVKKIKFFIIVLLDLSGVLWFSGANVPINIVEIKCVVRKYYSIQVADNRILE